MGSDVDKEPFQGFDVVLETLEGENLGIWSSLFLDYGAETGVLTAALSPDTVKYMVTSGSEFPLAIRARFSSDRGDLGLLIETDGKLVPQVLDVKSGRGIVATSFKFGIRAVSVDTDLLQVREYKSAVGE